MIRRAKADDLLGEILLADSGYGDSWFFRAELRKLGLDLPLQLQGTTRVWLLNSDEEHERIFLHAILA
ncbi:MAG: transposase [Polyangiaceae bacterium]|nr:transposase [Polyangiaceae bacterium]